MRVRASGINPSDVKNRNGDIAANRSFFEGEPGFVIPHCDGAGVVEAVGSGVDQRRVGQRVWLYSAQWQRPFGTAAEYVALPNRAAVDLPDNVSLEDGACFGVPLLTAYHAVTLAGDVAAASSGDACGRTVLVAGAAGAVGSYAVQVAKANGARVIGTVSSEAKAQIARAAGCDEVIDYRVQHLAAEVARLTAGRGVDHVVEVSLSANGPILGDLLARESSVAVYGSESPDASIPAIQFIRKSVRLQFFLVYTLHLDVLAEAKSALGELLSAGRIKTTIAARFPLGRIADAHKAIESGELIGNAVLII